MARPAEFDRNEVLEKAMNQFWHTGYTATSITDLVQATSLKPGSLYGAFTNKRGLFLEVVDSYASRSLNRVSSTFAQAGSPREGIETFFSLLLKDLKADEVGKSCLLVNTLLELSFEDEEIRAKVAAYLDQIESHFLAAIQKGQASGEIDNSVDAETQATFVMTSIWGLRVLSSKRPCPEKYAGVIAQVMRVLFTPAH
jgi:TetR/AcrR family transcriptional repressor of nem operon